MLDRDDVKPILPKKSSSYMNGIDTSLDNVLVSDSNRKHFLNYILFHYSSEVSHALAQMYVRVLLCILSTLLLSVLWWLDYSSALKNPLPVIFSLSYLALAISYTYLIKHFPDKFLWSRYIAIIVDCSIMSLLGYTLLTNGFFVYPILLWIMIANGLRFGLRHLYVANVAGVVGFFFAMTLNGTADAQPIAFMGMIMGLMLMPRFFVVIISKIIETNNELRKRKEIAEYLATHDTLTSLPNRKLLLEQLFLSLEEAKQKKEKLAVLFIDVDSFKQINDSFGHDIGDGFLILMVDCIKNKIQEADMLTRFGGDEFVLLLKNCNDEDLLINRIKHISTCSGRYYQVKQYQSFVTWSCGIAMFPEDGQDPTTLIKHADTAMYQSKKIGPNMHRFYTSKMSEEVSNQLTIRNELRRALESSQLQVYYQPQFDLHTGHIASAEALIRWYHPTIGGISPKKFIPIAEQSGLICPTFTFVLEQVCKDISGWLAKREDYHPIYINVSPKQLVDSNFLSDLTRITMEYRLPTDAIGIEITESALIENQEQVIKLLTTLKKKGFCLSLDDFGTGYSSLSYLKRFPFDNIKIDRSFVIDIPDDQESSGIVDIIIKIGKTLEMGIVAEGVETTAQMKWLRSRGCHIGQGYLFGKPMNKETYQKTIFNLT